MKLIFSRRKEIALIRARIKAGGTPLTRFEHRLIRTQKDDIVKCVFFFFSPFCIFHHSFSIHRIIPFLFIALILEEAIPFIAIYAPFMLPSTCILPSQQQRIEERRAEKAKTFATQYKYLYGQLKETESPKGFLPLQSLRLQEASTAVCGYVSSILVERGFE